MIGNSNMIKIDDDEIECVKAYDAKAKEMFGEYASPNFVYKG